MTTFDKLYQAVRAQKPVTIFLSDKNSHVKSYTGTVHELTGQTVNLETDDGHIPMRLSDVGLVKVVDGQP